MTQKEQLIFGSHKHREYLQCFKHETSELLLHVGKSTGNPVAPFLGQRDYHGIIIGAPKSGLSRAVLAIIGSTCLFYNTSELQVFYADFRDTDYSTLVAGDSGDSYSRGMPLIPNIAGIYPCKTKLKKLSFLEDCASIVHAREAWLARNHMQSFIPGKGLPHVLICIANALPAMENDSSMWLAFRQLLMPAQLVGIHFLLTGACIGDQVYGQCNLYKTLLSLHITVGTYSTNVENPSAPDNIGICTVNGISLGNNAVSYLLPSTSKSNLTQAFVQCADRYDYNFLTINDPLHLHKYRKE